MPTYFKETADRLTAQDDRETGSTLSTLSYAATNRSTVLFLEAARRLDRDHNLETESCIRSALALEATNPKPASGAIVVALTTLLLETGVEPQQATEKARTVVEEI